MFTSKAIALICAFTSLALAQDVDYDDLPSQCTSVCDPVVQLTQQCDDGRSDADQLSCVCQATNATALLPACEACYAMFDSDGHDNGKYQKDLHKGDPVLIMWQMSMILSASVLSLLRVTWQLLRTLEASQLR